MSVRPVFLPAFGKYLRALRDDHGWNQSQAVDTARRRGITLSYNTLRWIEDGKIKNPEPETLRGLSRLYGVGYEEVVGNYAQEKFGVRRSLPGAESEVKDFTTIPLLQSPISRGRALVLEPDPKHDGSLAFREDFVKLLTRPVVLRVGKKDAAMTPTIEPGDVVLIDQNLARRRRPIDGQIYALNTGPLTGQDGGTLQRVELKGRTLILSADHPDKSAYPTRTFEVKAATLPEVLVGQVVWVGRTLGTR